jgi:hypothetical protein
MKMKIHLSELEPFKEICHKICLNIPSSCTWEWDQKRKMAAVVLEEEDAEMVFYPLFKEFRNHWNFASINDAAEAVNEYIHTEYGLMPGQVFFTSHMVCNLVLGVAWWPWGNNDKVSMRIGIIPIKTGLTDDFTYQCLSRWLNIVD